jgi:uncharacterized RDD family membrane protein YckC
MEKESPELYDEKENVSLENQEVEEVTRVRHRKKKRSKNSVDYASLKIRVIAYIIDILVLIIPISILLLLMLGEDFVQRENYFISNFLAYIFTSIYYGYMESSKMQATIGKKLCGIKVIDMSGNTVKFKNAIVRYMLHAVSIGVFGLGIWAIAKNKRKQGWHDSIVDCYVVYKKRKT